MEKNPNTLSSDCTCGPPGERSLPLGYLFVFFVFFFCFFLFFLFFFFIFFFYLFIFSISYEYSVYCDRNFYGMCDKFCMPGNTTMNCTEDGTNICKRGKMASKFRY